MTTSTRIDLTVPFTRKEEAKALGAKWDAGQRIWYAPPGTDLRGFDRRWLPKECEIDGESKSAAISQELDADHDKGISLSELLTDVKSVVEKGLPKAVWVRAEISELRGKNGQLYPTLTERDDRGPEGGRAEIVAKVKTKVNLRHGRFAVWSAATLPLIGV